MFHVKHYENIINEEWLHMSRFTMKTERGTFYDVREMTKDSAKKKGYSYAFSCEHGDVYIKYCDDAVHYDAVALVRR